MPPGTLTESEVAQWLDRGRLEETHERRSYYRLLPEFSGGSGLEPMPLDAELGVYALPQVN